MSCVAPGHYACPNWFITITDLSSIIKVSSEKGKKNVVPCFQNQACSKHRGPAPLDSYPENTCLVVLVAKHPILYIASLFCYIPLYIFIDVCVKAKEKIMLRQLQKKLKKKIILSISGVTTCWKRHDNDVITGTFECCPGREVVSDEV